MALNAKKIPSNSTFERPEPLDPGTYPARIVQIIGKGLQEQRPYKGKEKNPAYEIMVTYELLDEFMVDKESGEELPDRPRWIHETFALHPLQSDRAKSTQRYMALDPDMKYDGNWPDLIAAPCMLTLVQNPSKKDPTRIYENVSSVSSMRPKEAKKAPELVNDPKIFDPEDPDLEVFLTLPDWIQDQIKENLNYEGSALEKLVEGHKGDSEGDDSQKPDKGEDRASGSVSDGADDEDDEEEDW